jgi:hypothetical protein
VVKVIHPSPRDPSGVGQMWREPGKQNRHIGREKRRAKEMAMAGKTTVTVPTVASEKKEKPMAKKAQDQTDETFPISEVDTLTPVHMRKESKEPRYGVTVNEGPVPTVDAEGKRAIESVREAEKSEAEKMAEGGTPLYPESDDK